LCANVVQVLSLIDILVCEVFNSDSRTIERKSYITLQLTCCVRTGAALLTLQQSGFGRQKLPTSVLQSTCCRRFAVS
jgi:hypothetical protein